MKKLINEAIEVLPKTRKFLENDSKIHAEIVLCDEAEKIRKDHNDAKFYIYGKKRPCLTCFSRLQMTFNHKRAETGAEGVERFSKESVKETTILKQQT